MSSLAGNSGSPQVRITLDPQSELKQHVPYSTGDHITGKVNLRFNEDTIFNGSEITFEGHTSIQLDNHPTSPPWRSKQRFLYVVHPARPNFLPEMNVAVCSTAHEQSFHFVVPERLLPYACTHYAEKDVSRPLHLGLPPTVRGSPRCCGGNVGPPKAEVSYVIRFRLWRRTADNQFEDIVNVTAPLCILPCQNEAPPLDLAMNNRDLIFKAEKLIRKSTFSLGKKGRLIAEASQPRALCLPRSYPTVRESVATATTAAIRFDPFAQNDQPPELTQIAIVLRSQTRLKLGTVPSRWVLDTTEELAGCHSTSFKLLPLSVIPDWTLHEPEGGSTSSINSGPIRRPPHAQSPGLHWTTSVTAPIILPQNKIFSPSFQSCSIAQSYSLDFTISYQTKSSAVCSPLVLKLPLEILASHHNEDQDRDDVQCPNYYSIQEGVRTSDETVSTEGAWFDSANDSQHSLPAYK